MNIVKHTIDAHFPRENWRGYVNPTDQLKLVYKAVNFADMNTTESAINFVFVHGSQMVKEAWLYYCELCHKKYGANLGKCLLIDLISHGDSALLNEGKLRVLNDWTDNARDINDVVRHARSVGGMKGPTIYVGHSKGGSSVLVSSIFETGLCAGVVAFDPVWTVYAENRDLFDEANKPYYDEFKNINYKFLANVHAKVPDTFKDRDAYNLWIDKKFGTRHMHPRIRESLREHLAYTLSDGTVKLKTNKDLQVAAYASAITMYSSNQILNYSPVGTLIIRGDTEDVTRPGSSENLVKRLGKTAKNSQLVVVEGGGHNICLNKPDECFAAMEAFLDKQYKRALAEYHYTGFTNVADEMANFIVRMRDEGYKSFAKL